MHKPARGHELDPLSAASAGLFALGITGDRRAEVLELLSAMLDLADTKGTVVLDQALYAVEERLGVDLCIDAYAWLEELRVIVRTANGWSIPGFALHIGPVGNTVESMQVLRRHIDALRSESAAGAGAEIVALPARTVEPAKRWQRAVPMAAAGIAASVAVLAGVSQFVPQAAVSGRRAALHADAPTSALNRSAGTAGVGGAATGTATSATRSSSAAATPTPTSGSAPGGVGCAAPKIITSITSVQLVRLALAGPNGETLWAAVVQGMATLTDTTTSLVLPGLSVIGHVIDGDTEPVLATLSEPVLVPGTPTPFNAVISLGRTEPTAPVTASATPIGIAACP